MTGEGNIYPYDRISILAAVNHAHFLSSFFFSFWFFGFQFLVYPHRSFHVCWHLFKHQTKNKSENFFQPEYFQCCCAFLWPKSGWARDSILYARQNALTCDKCKCVASLLMRFTCLSIEPYDSSCELLRSPGRLFFHHVAIFTFLQVFFFFWWYSSNNTFVWVLKHFNAC